MTTAAWERRGAVWLPPTAPTGTEQPSLPAGPAVAPTVAPLAEPAMATATRPSRASLVGLLVGATLALVAALGPMASAAMMTIGVETQVGAASGLPTSWMLPAALEGLGAVALVYLLSARPAGAMRWWSGFLIVASLLAGMAAQGSHAIWYDERTSALVLPWTVKLFVSFVPPISGGATLHLIVMMAESIIVTARALGEQIAATRPARELAAPEPQETPRAIEAPPESERRQLPEPKSQSRGRTRQPSRRSAARRAGSSAGASGRAEQAVRRALGSAPAPARLSEAWQAVRAEAVKDSGLSVKQVGRVMDRVLATGRLHVVEEV